MPLVSRLMRHRSVPQHAPARQARSAGSAELCSRITTAATRCTKQAPRALHPCPAHHCRAVAPHAAPSAMFERVQLLHARVQEAQAAGVTQARGQGGQHLGGGARARRCPHRGALGVQRVRGAPSRLGAGAPACLRSECRSTPTRGCTCTRTHSPRRHCQTQTYRQGARWQQACTGLCKCIGQSHRGYCRRTQTMRSSPSWRQRAASLALARMRTQASRRRSMSSPCPQTMRRCCQMHCASCESLHSRSGMRRCPAPCKRFVSLATNTRTGAGASAGACELRDHRRTCLFRTRRIACVKRTRLAVDPMHKCALVDAHSCQGRMCPGTFAGAA